MQLLYFQAGQRQVHAARDRKLSLAVLILLLPLRRTVQGQALFI